MKKELIIILISLIVIGCSKNQETVDTFTWDNDKAVYTVTTEDTVVSSKEFKRNFFVNLHHSDDLVLREEIVEEYFFNKDGVSELNRTKENFEFLEQSETFNHDAVEFNYVIDDTYLKVTIIINFEKINFNDINTLLFNYIGGEQVLNDERRGKRQT